MRYTTHVGQYNPKEAILDFSDQPKFWIPDPQDTNPILEVEFRNNYVITGLEIRGKRCLQMSDNVSLLGVPQAVETFPFV